MPADLVTALFVTALAASLLTRLWLLTRQMRHVAGHRGAVPAPFEARVPLAAHQRAADYTLAKGRLALVAATLGALVVLGWTLLGGLELLHGGLIQLLPAGTGPIASQLALLAAVVLVGMLLELPLEWVATFRLEQRFGFNRSTPGLWWADQAKGLVLAAVLGLPLAALVLWLMQAAGPLWWLWAWGVFVGFNLLMLVLWPTLIAPLFNRFEPLADEALAARVKALMQRAGFAAKGLFVMDGSRRSAHANAYFTGIGASKRVVFFDTLLAQLTPGEVEAVLAHELGHFRLRHVPRRLLTLLLASGAAFALLGWLASQSSFYTGLGVTPRLNGPNDALALVLFMLVLPSFVFFLSPLAAWMSRRDEYAADAYATRLADGRDLAGALVKLHADNASTLTPDPLYVRFHYSHPPAVERLAMLPPPRAAEPPTDAAGPGLVPQPA